jgi:serine/threonine protein kinase
MSTDASRKSTVPDPLVGKTLSNRFHIVERIATGGMGAVYKAEQIPLGREVAIKVLEQRTSVVDDDATFKQRFFLEAAAAAKLKHPNTITVHDYGQTDDGMYFIAMEYIEGMTLERRLKKQGPLTPAQTLHVALQICSSLREAHERGLVHRDMKPGNVMFAPRSRDPFFVKVLDFGLVKNVSGGKDDPSLTQGGVVMGSPRYMAPEQVRSLRVDHRTDIYSLGATLYHMLAGSPPFAMGKPFDAMAAHVSMPVPPLKETWPDCPAGPNLEALVMRCMAKSPEQRFQSMDELMDALHACLEEAGANMSSGGNYVLASQQLLLSEKSDSDPRLNATPSGLRWNEGDSAPKISGPQPVPEGVDVDVEMPTIAHPMGARKVEKASSKRPLIIGGLAMLVIAIAIAVGAAAFGGDDEPSATQTAAASDLDDPAPVDHPAEASLVRVVSEPPGATIRHEGSDIGDAPVGVPVPPGERWNVEVVLEGYQTRRVTLLGGQAEFRVQLRPVAAEEATEEPAADEGAEEEPARRRFPIRRPAASSAQPSSPPAAETSQPERQPTQRRDLHNPWAED